MLAAFKFCSPFFLNHSIALLFFSLVSCTYVINCCLHILLFSFSFYHLMPMNLFFLFFILICHYFILSMFVKCSFFLYLNSTSVCLNYSFNLFFFYFIRYYTICSGRILYSLLISFFYSCFV